MLHDGKRSRIEPEQAQAHRAAVGPVPPQQIPAPVTREHPRAADIRFDERVGAGEIRFAQELEMRRPFSAATDGCRRRAR